MTSSSFTMMAFVNRKRATREDLAIFGTDERYGLYLIMRNNRFYFGLKDSRGNPPKSFCEGSAVNEPGRWQHVAFVYNSADLTQQIFVNGLEVAHCTRKGRFVGRGQIKVGHSHGAERWVGTIQGVQIHASALTPHEIQRSLLGRSNAALNGASRIVVQAFKQFRWQNEFSISMWFRPTGLPHKAGVIHAGYYATGSFEVHLASGGAYYRTRCLTWILAQLECQAGGGDLVVITDSAKNTEVTAFMRSFSDYGSCDGASGPWLGAHQCSDSSGSVRCTWVDGSKWKYIGPGLQGRDPYLRMSTSGGWGTRGHRSTDRSIGLCERPGQVQGITTKHGAPALTAGVTLDSSHSSIAAFSPTMNAWNHVAMTYDGSSPRVFLNGRSETSVKDMTVKPIQSDTPLTIGQAGDQAKTHHGDLTRYLFH